MENGHNNRIETLIDDMKTTVLAAIAKVDEGSRQRDLVFSMALHEMRLEQIQDRRAMADGFLRIEARHDVLLSRVDTMEVHLLSLDTKVTQLDTKVTQLDAKVTELDAKVTHLDAKLTHLDDKVTHLDTKVTQLDTKVTELEVFASDTKQRLERIETHLELAATSPPSA